MKKLKVDQMENSRGGWVSASAFWGDVGCAGIGFTYGLINPILGVVAGLACAGIVSGALRVSGSKPKPNRSLMMSNRSLMMSY